jgi:hypothetical protein
MVINPSRSLEWLNDELPCPASIRNVVSSETGLITRADQSLGM